MMHFEIESDVARVNPILFKFKKGQDGHMIVFVDGAVLLTVLTDGRVRLEASQAAQLGRLGFQLNHRGKVITI